MAIIEEEIGKRIKEIRKDKKLSQVDFANRLTLSQNHLSCLEKGIRKITDKFINDVCKEYSVNKDWMLTGAGEKYINIVDELNIEDTEIKEFFKRFLELDMQTKLSVMNLVDFKVKSLSKK